MPAEVGVARDTRGRRALPSKKMPARRLRGRLAVVLRNVRAAEGRAKNGSPGVDCTHSILDGFERGDFNTEGRGL